MTPEDVGRLQERWHHYKTVTPEDVDALLAHIADLERDLACSRHSAEGLIRTANEQHNRISRLESALARIVRGDWTESGDICGAARSELWAIKVAQDALAAQERTS